MSDINVIISGVAINNNTAVRSNNHKSLFSGKCGMRAMRFGG